MKKLWTTVCVAYVSLKVIKGSADLLIKIGEAKALLKLGKTFKDLVDEISEEKEESDE